MTQEVQLEQIIDKSMERSDAQFEESLIKLQFGHLEVPCTPPKINKTNDNMRTPDPSHSVPPIVDGQSPNITRAAFITVRRAKNEVKRQKLHRNVFIKQEGSSCGSVSSESHSSDSSCSHDINQSPSSSEVIGSQDLKLRQTNKSMFNKRQTITPNMVSGLKRQSSITASPNLAGGKKDSTQNHSFFKMIQNLKIEKTYKKTKNLDEMRKTMFTSKRFDKSLFKNKIKRQQSFKITGMQQQNRGFVLDNPDELKYTAAMRFQEYKDQFVNMTKRKKISTNHSIIQIILTKDEKYALTLQKVHLRANMHDQLEYMIIFYNIENGSVAQDISIQGHALRADEIVQNNDGTVFCLPYFDKGFFKIHTFTLTNKCLDQFLDINQMLGINDRSQPPRGFTYPLIYCMFITKTILFVNMFDSFALNHWYFKYDYEKKDFVGGDPQFIKINCQPSNFPIGHHYDDLKDEIYCIYRHGQCVTMRGVSHMHNHKKDKQRDMNQKIDFMMKQIHNMHENIPMEPWEEQQDCPDRNQESAEIEQMICDGLGKMIYHKNILIGRLSENILFFKRSQHSEEDIGYTKEMESKFHWECYHSLSFGDQIGQLQNVIGNQEFTITTQEKIHYYSLDNKTLKPIPITVIFNFMACSQILSGPKYDINISYMLDHNDFLISQRNKHHQFKVQIEHENFDKIQCIDLKEFNSYAVSSKNKVKIYSQTDFSLTYTITIEEAEKPLSSKHKHYLEVLRMAVSKDQSRMILLMGSFKRDKKELKSLHVFEINDQASKQVYAKNIEKDLKDISMCVSFNDQNINEIHLVDEFQIYLFNYQKETISIIYRFNFELDMPPETFCFDAHQSRILVGASDDVLLLDLKQGHEIDIDKIFRISEVKASISFKNKYYILANKYERSRGLFLLEIDQNVNSTDKESQTEKYMIKWKNQLEISDCEMFLATYQDRQCCQCDKGQEQNCDHDGQELIISFKQIYSNLYNVIVINPNSAQTGMVFQHQSHHIWERKIKGLYLQNSKDFLNFTSDGITALSLARHEHEKQFKDQNGKTRQLHSLHECTYLKVMPSNHLLFKYSHDRNDIYISVQEQFTHAKTKESGFLEIYKLKVQEMSLRELLLFQGLFSCPSQSEIVSLIENQPTTIVFFKSFLELDLSNLVSILSFDSQCMNALLKQRIQNDFSHDFPIFYKIRRIDPYNPENCIYRSAFDIALENNQTQALDLMIEYMVKYQNSYIYSYLFEDNFTLLMEKNINIEPLLRSDILCHQFQFESWPSTHTDYSTQIMPYNGSLFDLRFKYDEVFPQLAKDEPFQEEARLDPNQKVYKIKYTLNQLPKMGGDLEDRLMEMIGDTESVSIFTAKVLQDLIDFKWIKYARTIHFLGAFIHLIYVITFCVYVSEIYLENDEGENKTTLLIMMAVSLFYALVYDFRQLFLSGFDYFLDIWNYSDQLHIWLGYLNIYFQFAHPSDSAPRTAECQLTMILCTVLMLIKTFFFLRIFANMTKLVIMMKNVISDLRVFIFFYVIMVIIFSIILGVLFVGNYDHPKDEFVNDYYKTLIKKPTGFAFNEYPGYEYKHVTLFTANILRTLRYSLGDYDFGAINHLNKFESTMFWITWVFTIMMTCVVFLNFIIAEVSQSYSKVQESVEELILQERAQLIAESESMMFNRTKLNQSKFPMYIVMREIES